MTQENLPSEPSFSFWSGIYLPLVYKGHSIVTHNSSWTSRMTTCVDGEIVFSQASWKFICEQDIPVGAETVPTRFAGIKSALFLRFMKAIHESLRPIIPCGRWVGSRFFRSCYWVWLLGSLSTTSVYSGRPQHTALGECYGLRTPLQIRDINLCLCGVISPILRSPRCT